MKVRFLIHGERVSYHDSDGRDHDPLTGEKYDRVPPGGGWTTHPISPGEVIEGPDAWKLCLQRELDPKHPDFGRRYAEPIDDEAKAAIAPYVERMRAQLAKLRGMTREEAARDDNLVQEAAWLEANAGASS